MKLACGDGLVFENGMRHSWYGHHDKAAHEVEKDASKDEEFSLVASLAEGNDGGVKDEGQDTIASQNEAEI